MAKNLISGQTLASLAKIYPLPPQKKLFCDFYPDKMLDIVASYHCMQFQGKRMIQTQENGEKPHFRPNLGSLGLNSGC